MVMLLAVLASVALVASAMVFGVADLESAGPAFADGKTV